MDFLNLLFQCYNALHILWGHSVIMFSQNDQNFDPHPPSALVRTCLILLNPAPPSWKHSELYITTSFHHLYFHHHHYPIAKSCYFIDSWTPVLISNYKCHKNYSQYSPDMNVSRVLIYTNGVYY